MITNLINLTVIFVLMPTAPERTQPTHENWTTSLRWCSSSRLVTLQGHNYHTIPVILVSTKLSHTTENLWKLILKYKK
uniref:Secreted protein n=1 Tax=Arion vulgaris TaxID=1028688 RepID=A0A0B6ZSC1_9EUPU